jgi:hypothetical protein
MGVIKSGWREKPLKEISAKQSAFQQLDIGLVDFTTS